MKTLIAECRRRGVFPVVAFYVVGAWVALQVFDLAFESWGIPDHRLQIVWIAAFIGFPIACFLGWRYDFTTSGVVRTPSSVGADPTPIDRLDVRIFLTIGILAIGAVVASVQTLRTDFDRNNIEAELRSIAVMPFADLSVDGDQAYLGDGIAEEILNLLAQYSDLTVISRSSAFALRDQGLSLSEIGQRLGAAFVLEGSVRKAGDRVRITAQLIDAGDDAHLWSDNFDREFHDVFAIQDEVAAHVTQELQARLRAAPRRPGTMNEEAYDLYLQAMSLLARRKSDDLPQALEMLDRSISLDPAFAPAYGGRALVLFWIGNGGEEEAAQQALEIDPENSEALAVLGRRHLDRGDEQRGRELLNQAIRVNPSNPMPHRWLAISYTKSDANRYYAAIRNVYRINPLDPSIQLHLAFSARNLGRYSEALEHAKLQMNTNQVMGYIAASQVYRDQGRLAALYKTQAHAIRTGVGGRIPYTGFAVTLTYLGEYELADQWLELARQWRPNWDQYVNAQAHTLAHRGDLAAVRELVVSAVERGILSGQMAAINLLIRAQNREAARLMMVEHLRLDSDHPVPVGQELDGYLLYAQSFPSEHIPANVLDLVVEARSVIVERMDQGVVHNEEYSLDYLLALSEAILGNADAMKDALRRALASNSLWCRECLLYAPAWDPYRNDPEFMQILDEQQYHIEQERQLLASEGLLVPASELVELQEFNFDPFAL